MKNIFRNKVKKVLFFIPPAFTYKDNLDINPLPPLGLGYLGAVLENNDIEVKIVDCLIEGWDNKVSLTGDIIRVGLSFKEIEEIVASYGPDIVGVNNLFTKQRENAHKIYELTKRINKNIITIAGGAHPTALPEFVLSDENVDLVVIGEGENTIIDLVNVIERKKEVSELDGVGYKNNGEVKIIPKTKFITDLDKLPFPARHLLNMEKYFGLKASHGMRRKKRFSPIITSRGCPAGCAFCSAHKVWGKRFRQRSPENVISELKYLKERYKIEELMFEDDNTTLNVKRAEQIFDLMIQEKLNLVWDTPNGVAAFALNKATISKMKEAGCYRLNLAVETGNQFVMDSIIKKPLKLEKVEYLVKHAQKIGLGVGIFLIIGMPGETEEMIWDSFKFASKLEVYTPFISIATPYPGSELYNTCKEKKYIPPDFSLDDLFIRSFCISTENWDGKRLKEIFTQGRKFLIISHIKNHPINFFHKRILNRFLTDPRGLLSQMYKFIINRGKWSVLR